MAERIEAAAAITVIPGSDRYQGVVVEMESVGPVEVSVVELPDATMTNGATVVVGVGAEVGVKVRIVEDKDRRGLSAIKKAAARQGLEAATEALVVVAIALLCTMVRKESIVPLE
jgi:hypothetical protein